MVDAPFSFSAFIVENLCFLSVTKSHYFKQFGLVLIPQCDRAALQFHQSVLRETPEYSRHCLPCRADVLGDPLMGHAYCIRSSTWSSWGRMHQTLVYHNPTARGSLSIDTLFLLHIDYTVLPPEKSTFISKATAISILVCFVTSFRQGSHVPLHHRLRHCYLRSCFKSSSGVVMGAMPKFSTR